MAFKTKEAQLEYTKRYYQENKETIKARVRAWREANPERVIAHNSNKDREDNKKRCKESYRRNPNAYKDSNMRRMYGISLEEFRQLLETQQGICAACDEELEKPVLDHNHITGKIRGIICSACNLALGMTKDSSKKLRKLADYVDKHAESC